jgi:tetratricopeptide (TPR) repeat protein
MKISGNKRSFWVYFGLICMIAALILFSVLPLVTAIVKEQNQSQPSNVTLVNTRLEQEALGYQLVIEREPDNQTALRGLLNIRLQQGDLEGVVDPLARLSQLNPDIIDYSLLLAQTQTQLQDYQGAQTTYQKALQNHPANPALLKNWTDMLISQNQGNEAISVVKNQLNQPEIADKTALQLLLGEIYTSQGKTEKAIAVYNQAITVDKEDFRPVLAKAILLQQQKSPSAEILFQQAIELAPIQYKDQIKELSVQS